jgi:para-aminobenzoate synthetase component 1
MQGPDNKTLLQLLKKASGEEYACILLSNSFPDNYGKYEILAGFGAQNICEKLDDLRSDKLQFGFFSYDLKNQIEDLKSENPSWISVPDMLFFEPEYFYKLYRNGTEEGNFNIASEALLELHSTDIGGGLEWMVPSKDAYLDRIEGIRNDIKNGVFYELNFCTEWKAEDADNFDPFVSFYRLNQVAPAPFAAFFKLQDRYLLCTSPERFVHAAWDKIVSQPIKGTRKRQQDHHQDSLVRTELMTSEKDRAENVMITDLVRNDLSRFCMAGTVEVEELCGIHSFSHVHQMISTVVGTMAQGTSVADVIRAAFPMGSMTGAPKIKVMECIEQYENFRRGWYSGSLGYLEPGGFDLNVVIRSLQFDAQQHKLG